jgi:RNA polymerase sigma factor (sigma-70 family)
MPRSLAVKSIISRRVSEHRASSTADLLRRAASADRDAWRELVDRYDRVAHAVARAHGLPEHDSADVAQATWLTLAQHLTSLREPDRLPGWLATTARRESLRIIAVRRRERPTQEWLDPTIEHVDPEAAVVAADRDRAIRLACDRLPARCRVLLDLLADEPDLTYANAALALGIERSSVGPTKSRCLAALRRQLLVAGLLDADVITPGCAVAGPPRREPRPACRTRTAPDAATGRDDR